MSRVASLFGREPASFPAPMTEGVHWKPLRDLTDLLLLGAIHRNLYVGGSEVNGIPATATGDLVLLEALPWSVDNTSSQVSGFSTANGGTLTVQMRFLVRVSNGAINVTPKVLYGSSMSAIATPATLTGAVSCAATDADYSGTNQIQTVTLTLPAGLKYFKPALTVAGTPAADYQVWGRAYYDCFIQS